MQLDHHLSDISLIKGWAKMLSFDSSIAETSTRTLAQLMEQPDNQSRVFWLLGVPSAILLFVVVVGIPAYIYHKRRNKLKG